MLDFVKNLIAFSKHIVPIQSINTIYNVYYYAWYVGGIHFCLLKNVIQISVLQCTHGYQGY